MAVPIKDQALGAEQKLLVSVSTAAAMVELSRSMLYELIASGEIEAIYIGTARRIPVDVLKQWIQQKRAQQSRA